MLLVFSICFVCCHAAAQDLHLRRLRAWVWAWASPAGLLVWLGVVGFWVLARAGLRVTSVLIVIPRLQTSSTRLLGAWGFKVFLFGVSDLGFGLERFGVALRMSVHVQGALRCLPRRPPPTPFLVD